MRTKVVITLIALILIMGIGFAQQSPGNQNYFGEWITDPASSIIGDLSFDSCYSRAVKGGIAQTLFTNSFIAIMISFLIYVFFYLTAKIAGNENAGVILTTKLSTLGTLIFFILITTIAYSTLYENNGIWQKYQRNAFEYNTKLILTAATYSFPVIIANYFYFAIYNFQLPLTTGRNNVIGFQLSIGPLFKPLIDIATTLSSYLTTVMGVFIGRQYFLCLITSSFITILFPIGVFFRAFNVTKGIGATLMALSLAFSIIYPLLLSFNYAIFESLGTYDLGLAKTEAFGNLNALLGIIGGGITVGTIAVAVGKAYAAIFSQLNSLGITQAFFSALYTPFLTIMGLLSIAITGIMIEIYIGLINLLLIYGLILPIVNFYITLLLAKDLSKALGAEMDFSAFLRLI